MLLSFARSIATRFTRASFLLSLLRNTKKYEYTKAETKFSSFTWKFTKVRNPPIGERTYKNLYICKKFIISYQNYYQPPFLYCFLVFQTKEGLPLCSLGERGSKTEQMVSQNFFRLRRKKRSTVLRFFKHLFKNIERIENHTLISVIQ